MSNLCRKGTCRIYDCSEKLALQLLHLFVFSLLLPFSFCFCLPLMREIDIIFDAVHSQVQPRNVDKRPKEAPGKQG